MSQEPNSDLPQAMWRYRWLVLGIVIACAIGVQAFGATQPASYSASSSFVIEDPRSTSLFDSLGGVSPTRYLADQVAILQSGAVAARAEELALEAGYEALDRKVFLDNSRFLTTTGSNFVEISFRAEDADAAVFGANAVVDAYQDISRPESTRTAASTLEPFDQKISAIDTDILAIQSQIDTLEATGPVGSDIASQYQTAADQLAALYSSISSGEVTDEQRQELTDLSTQLTTIQQIADLEGENPELADLRQEQAALIGRRSALQTLRDQIEIDAELEGESMSLYFPAVTATETYSIFRLSLAIGLLLGGLLAAGVSVFLASRKAVFAGRFEPETLLHSPLLADVPSFASRWFVDRLPGHRRRGTNSELPVRDAPTSASAEAFRFAMAAIANLEPGAEADSTSDGEGVVKSLAVVSGSEGDGKTIVTANLALAAARRGGSILVIDADFGAQQLSRRLSSDSEQQLGLTDVVDGGHLLATVVEQIELAPGVEVDLLRWGTVSITAPDFISSADARAFFNTVRDEYDLVLIDTPPILHAAYASLVAKFADRALVVVVHRSSQKLLEDVRDRLAMVGATVGGYIYNRAPFRKEHAGLEESLKDVLGSDGTDSADEAEASTPTM